MLIISNLTHYFDEQKYLTCDNNSIIICLGGSNDRNNNQYNCKDTVKHKDVLCLAGFRFCNNYDFSPTRGTRS